MLAVALLTPGCVIRKLHVRSTPPGAELYLDGASVGPTPFEREFVSYGSHHAELRLPGHERLVTVLEVERPWWQVFPVNFVTDVLWPFDLEDVHVFTLELQPLGEGGTWDEAREAYEALLEAREELADDLSAPPGGG